MTRLLLMAAVAIVMVLAAAGVSAGATWDVNPGAGTPIQDVIDGATLSRYVSHFFRPLFRATQLWELYINPIINHLRPISAPSSHIFPQS